MRSIYFFLSRLLAVLFGLVGFPSITTAYFSTDSGSDKMGLYAIGAIMSIIAIFFWVRSYRYKGKNINGRATVNAAGQVEMEYEDATKHPLYKMTAKQILDEYCITDRLGNKPWHDNKATAKQLNILKNYDIACHKNITKGEVSLVLDAVFTYDGGTIPPTDKDCEITDYKNLSSDSPVVAYRINKDAIQVRFNDGHNRDYLYTYKSAGKGVIEKMKKLAVKGEGLGAYIKETVKTDYADKW